MRVRDVANKAIGAPKQLNCPTCHRPWHGSPDVETSDRTPGPGSQPTFFTSEYFRMLSQSTPGSAESSSPPSPRRRLVHPVGRHRNPSPRLRPPPDAEFIGSSPAPPSQTHGISEAAFSPGNFEKFFTVEKELGRGGRGVVQLVRHVLDNVTLGYFACKRLPVGNDHAWLEKVLVEVQVLQELSHQNLVSYRHVWLEDFQVNAFGPSIPCVFILQQYCNGGDLHNYICGAAQAATTTQELKERIRRRSKGETELPRNLQEPLKLHFDDIYSFFNDIISGLQFLHHSGFIHRDLKPSNCLLHRTGSDLRVLVSDFGEVQYESATRKSTGATGTISYCAPEVLRRLAPDGPLGNFTFKSDIFSLGMILYFLCFATLPYRYANVLNEEKEDVDSLRAEIIQWEGFFDNEKKLRPELPDALYAFLKKLLSISPDDRPSADDVHTALRTGAGLQEHPERPNRRNSTAPEELTPGHRIVSMDSPAPSNRRAQTHAQSTALSRSLPSFQRRRPASREPPRLDTAIDDSEDDPFQSPDHDNRSPDRHLIRHPTASPPGPESPQEFTMSSQYLLPAPEVVQTRLSRLLAFLKSSSSTYIFRVIVLVAKIISLIQPCATKGISAPVVYPMLLLAVAEFAFPRYAVMGASLALLLHVFVLGVALHYNKLCARPAWESG